jgi:hypothetical protein
MRLPRSVTLSSSVLFLLWPTPALANIGLPATVALYLPPAWFALLPIILVESWYGVYRLAIPAQRALVAQAVANGLSTLVGLPLIWIVFVLAGMLTVERLAPVAPKVSQTLEIVLGAGWLGPGAESTSWTVPWAVAVLTVLFYVMSVVSEYLVVARFFSDLPGRVIRRWVVRANAISYAFLVVVVLSGWLWPRAAQPMFSVMSPVTEVLVGSVSRLMRAHSAATLAQVEPPLIRAAAAGDLQAMRALIQKGVDVNARDQHGGTALHVAAGRGDQEATRLLLEAGADVNARRNSPNDYTPLHSAAYTGNGATTKMLLSAGAKVNDAAGGGWTPLMFAMLYGRRDVVESLLAGGAKVNARSPTGWTALKEAQMRGHRDVATRLLRAGAIKYPDGSR